jgi:uncharacterized protein (AIM24 family)
MLDRPATFWRRVRDIFLTALRRWCTGEPVIQDRYTAQRDQAVLGISSNQIGGNVVPVDLVHDLSTGILIARRSVYFGSQEGIKLRIHSPAGLMRKIYGPGLFMQEFRIAEGYEERAIVFIQIDSEMRFKELGDGETFTMDVLHAHAWESSVRFSLVKFGSVAGRLVRGDLPYWIQFRGPGKLWYSTSSFPNGYIGWYFTPAHWVYTVREFITSLPQRIFGSRT